ncbi:MAG: hypothetical protein IJ039_04145, partial [Clostridia bacterium]|nr:hypothetical protein [Clostridia bacterium]
MKKIIIPIVLVVCVPVLLFAVFSVLDYANEKTEDKLLEYISEYQQDETLIFSDRNRLYFNNLVIETKGQLLYATKESLYQYYFDNKNDVITVKLTSLISNAETVVVEKKCKGFKKACMYDENVIYIVTEKEYFLYDIENDIYEPMSELAVSEFDSMIKYNSTVERTSFFKNHKEYTITRKEDNVSKNVSTKDILEV